MRLVAFQLWMIFVFLGGTSITPGPLQGQDAETRIVPKLSTSLELATRPDVVKELSLTAEQVAALNELLATRQEAYKRFAEVLRPGASATDVERAQQREKVLSQLVEIERGINETLLPHQLKRFDQLLFQYQTRSQSSSGTVLHKRVSDRLGLTDSQQARIREVASNHQQKYQARLAEMKAELDAMRQDAVDEILKQLTREQRKEYESLLGPHFSFDSPLGSDKDNEKQ